MSKPVTSFKPALKSIKQVIDQFSKTEHLPSILIWKIRSDIEYVTAVIGIRNDFVPFKGTSKGGTASISKKPTPDELAILLPQIQVDIEKANTFLENKKYEETYAHALNIIFVLDQLLKVNPSIDKINKKTNSPSSK